MMNLQINKEHFTIIAGPCAAESKELCLEIAKEMNAMCNRYNFQYVFKASYKKANRSSGISYRGPGLKKGLQFLSAVKEELGIPILTDVHCQTEIKRVAQVADILQIPAFLCRQTELIEASANTGKIINIKKGQFLAPEDMKLAMQKVFNTGNDKVLITERGTCFGYHNLVVDFRGLQIMDGYNIPIIFDVTHSIQRPSSGGEQTGGNPEFIETLTRAAVATGHLSGLFIETHPEPKKAKSDALSMLPLSQMDGLLRKIKIILECVRKL